MYGFTSGGIVRPIYCGLWTCPRCSRKNARMWAWRARLQLKRAGVDYYFITLTLGAAYKTPSQAFEALPGLWDKVRKWVKRAMTGETWSYCAFIEGQPRRSFMPHFHILSSVSIGVLARTRNYESDRKRYGARKFIRIRDWAVKRGLGFEADERRIDGPEAGSYVSKYASKQSPATPRGFRRVRSSQDWHKVPPREGVELYVRSRSEHLSQFLIRVSDATGVLIDVLWERWRAVYADSEQVDDS